MEDQLGEKIKGDFEIAKLSSGITLKEIIAANRKFLKKREEDKINVENETGLKISAIGSGKVYISCNPFNDTNIREGLGDAPDETYEVTRYDVYTIDEVGNIECIEKNNRAYNAEGQKSDINNINTHKQKLIETAKKYKEETLSRIDLPDTDLSVLMKHGNINLVHNLEPDSKGDFLLDDGADLWISILGHLDSISVVTGEEVIEDMSELLDEINVPEDQVPEYIKQNIGEKISVFSKKDRSGVYTHERRTYKITNYSKTKEKLANIVKTIRNKKHTKEIGENNNERGINN